MPTTSQIESRLDVNSFSISLNYSESQPGGSVFDVNFVLTRVKPDDFRRWCKIGDQAALADELLDKGQFLINGDCCCPCQNTFFFKMPDNKRVDDDTAEIQLQFGVQTSFCRFSNAEAFDQSEPMEPAPAIITQVEAGSKDRSAEQTILFDNPAIAPDAPTFSGSTQLNWTDPDGAVFNFIISPFVATPNMGDLIRVLTHAGWPVDIQVTAEGNGIRLGFLGKYANKSVALVTEAGGSTLMSQVWHPAKEAFGASFRYIPDVGAAFDIASVSGTNLNPCGSAFNATQHHHAGTTDWDASISS